MFLRGDNGQTKGAWSRYLRISVLLLATACGGGGSCLSCDTTEYVAYPDPIPEGGEPIDAALRLRLTQTALDFVVLASI